MLKLSSKSHFYGRVAPEEVLAFVLSELLRAHSARRGFSGFSKRTSTGAERPKRFLLGGCHGAGEAVAGVRRRHPDMLRPRVIIRIRRRVRCDRRGQEEERVTDTRGPPSGPRFFGGQHEF